MFHEYIIRQYINSTILSYRYRDIKKNEIITSKYMKKLYRYKGTGKIINL